MLTLILIRKIISLAILIATGILLVKTGVLKASDSFIFSKLSMYILLPCVVFHALCVERSPELGRGILLSFTAGILAHLLLCMMTSLLRRLFSLDYVETASVFYSNAGNLVIPFVTALFGEDYLVYASGYLLIQMVFLWSHGVILMSGNRKIKIKKILLNPNMIAMTLGVLVYLLQIPIPQVVDDAVTSLSAMLAPCAMLITGMLMSGSHFTKMLKNARLYLVSALRLVLCPLLIILVLRLALRGRIAQDWYQILMITALGAMTPCASTITQMAQLYDRDAVYAGEINVWTTVISALSMPAMITLYQLMM